MTNLKEHLENFGYLVVPNFISQETVKLLRQESELLLSQEKDATLKPTSLLKNQTMTSVIFSTDFTDVLNSLSDKYKYFLPNFTVRRNLYIGWHTDDEFVEPDQEILPGVLQCNIYLQDNLKETGGGIDIARGTHLLSKNEKKLLINNNSVPFEAAKTKAGDLLIFDYRVIHRSSIPIVPVNNLNSRLALQWTVSLSQDKAHSFMKYLLRRQQEKLHLSDFTDQRALGYFFDAVNVAYPTSFDVPTRNAISLSSITVPTFAEIRGIQ